MYWDPNPEAFTLPWLNWPILWYGVFFAVGFLIAFPIFTSVLSRYFLYFPESASLDARARRKKAVSLADRLTAYIVLATLIGARLGHFLFYERPSEYLRDPLEILRIREGGLASHGALIGILLAVALFRYTIRHQVPHLTWICLLDFLAVPAGLVACCIRVGNFFNQEILGKPTTLPWGITFGHPIDGSSPISRHPVQLYEALFYLFVFFLLWRLSYLPKYLLTRGKLIGLFLLLVFSFRFLIESLKVEQSFLLPSSSFLTMGQILSLPAMIAGALFFFWKRKKTF